MVEAPLKWERLMKITKLRQFQNDPKPRRVRLSVELDDSEHS